MSEERSKEQFTRELGMHFPGAPKYEITTTSGFQTLHFLNFSVSKITDSSDKHHEEWLYNKGYQILKTMVETFQEEKKTLDLATSKQQTQIEQNRAKNQNQCNKARVNAKTVLINSIKEIQGEHCTKAITETKDPLIRVTESNASNLQSSSKLENKPEINNMELFENFDNTFF